MRIAVASEGLDVSSHFGCCTNFNFYQVENGELVDSRNLPSQGHLCGSQANFLRQIEVKVLLCGTISEIDAESMKAAGTVVQGAKGRAITAADNYLKQASTEELAALGEPLARYARQTRAPGKGIGFAHSPWGAHAPFPLAPL